jgi:dTDP-4-amino-4,6-dideoxygalactose transaminase
MGFFGDGGIILAPSGRASIFAILSCLDRRKVIIPAYTCKAVVEACRLAGKDISFVELIEGGYNIDPVELEGKLDQDSILVLTHQFGYPADVERILPIAEKAGAIVIEDCAASLGTRIDGRLTGTFGVASAFSFDSTKRVTAPLKGGFMLVRDGGLYARCSEFAERNFRPVTFGLKSYWLTMGMILKIIGNPFLYRIFHWLKFGLRGTYTDESLPSRNVLSPFYTRAMGEFQASVALRQLDSLEAIIERRRAIYAIFSEGLKGIEALTLPPVDLANCTVPVRFPIVVKCDKLAFYSRCVNAGLDMGFSFTFIDSPKEYVISHDLARKILNLPFYFNLSDKEAKRIVAILKEAAGVAP